MMELKDMWKAREHGSWERGTQGWRRRRERKLMRDEKSDAFFVEIMQLPWSDARTAKQVVTKPNEDN